MNKQYDNTNKVSVWPGDKSRNPKAPDLRGTVNINGVDYTISLWNNNSQNANAPVMTGSVQLKQARPQGGNSGYNQQPVQQQAQGVNNSFQSDEIPFS